MDWDNFDYTKKCTVSGSVPDSVYMDPANCECFPVPVCRFISVSGSGCPAGFAVPVCICSGSIALHCIIVLVTHCKILRFKRVSRFSIHFRVYSFKMDSGRVLCGSRAFPAFVCSRILQDNTCLFIRFRFCVLIGLHSII